MLEFGSLDKMSIDPFVTRVTRGIRDTAAVVRVVQDEARRAVSWLSRDDGGGAGSLHGVICGKHLRPDVRT
jgi:hypothetical protein